jgi:glycosyltransferase involved in cell wall biosynthesis
MRTSIGPEHGTRAATRRPACSGVRKSQLNTRNRIRLALYIHAPRIGGAETYFRDLIHALDPAIFEVHAFIPPWPVLVSFLDLEKAPNIQLHTVNVIEPAANFATSATQDPRQSPVSFGTESRHSRARRVADAAHLPASVQRVGHDALRYLTLPANRRRLVEAFAPHHIDVLHVVNGGYPGAASALAAVLAGKTTARRRVMTVCSTPMPRTILGAAERVVDKQISESLNAVIVPAERPALALEQRGFPSKAMAIIPWGARSNPHQPDPDARLRLGLTVGAPVIVCIANFTPTKGQTVIVDALPDLAKRFPGLQAILAGDGPELASVRRRAEGLGLAGTVRFPGSVKTPWDLLQAADVFVLASEIEGLPLVVLEAMSEGVPVVATDVGGMPEAVVDGETGYLVPSGDAEALKTAIARILSDPAVAKRMRRAAVTRYERRFTMARMLEAHRELYLRLAHAGDPRDRHRR